MPDESIADRIGFPVRGVETVRYRVVKPLPRPNLPAVGVVFKAWPWGLNIASIEGYGPIAGNHEIADWEKAGLIEREERAGK